MGFSRRVQQPNRTAGTAEARAIIKEFASTEGSRQGWPVSDAARMHGDGSASVGASSAPSADSRDIDSDASGGKPTECSFAATLHGVRRDNEKV